MNMLPKVPLGKVLIERKEKPNFDDLLSGKTPIIKKIGFNDGKIVLRKDGRTKTNMILIMPGDLVLSGINAAKGAIAVYDKVNSYPIAATIHYGSYIPIEKEVNVNYLWFLLRSDFFRYELNKQIPGGIKTELKANRFLPVIVPLPSIKEQHRILSLIESLASKVEEVMCLQQEALTDSENLIESTLFAHIEKNKEKWKLGPISQFAKINPSRKNQIKLKEDSIVSFVPMRAVDAYTGEITKSEPRPFFEVRKGYKWFVNGDLIFARITPCMENGKAALAKNLINGTGFGSTEFHVIRPGPEVTSEWLHRLVRQRSFRMEAKENFKGTAGQQRVPKGFLENKIIPVPPIEEQKRITAHLNSIETENVRLHDQQLESQKEIDSLFPSILNQMFRGGS